MSVLVKVFLFAFLVIGVVGFFGLMVMMEQENKPTDAVLNTSVEAYYNSQQAVNKTMNQTMQYGRAAGIFLSPLPIFIMICVIAGALMLFLLVAKKR
jgi:flagellar biosynthesis protein FlhB